MNLVIRVWQVIALRRKIQVLSAFVLLVVIGLLEILSLGLFGVLLKFITSPDSPVVAIPSYLSYLFSLFGLKTSDASGPGIVPGVVLCFAASVGAAGGARTFVTWFCSRLSAALGTDVVTIVYEACLREDYEEHIRHRAGELVSLVRDKSSEVINAIFFLLNLGTAVIVGLLIVCGLIFLDPGYFLACGALLGFFYCLCAVFARQRMSRNSKLIAAGYTRIMKVAQEAFGGFRDIILDGSHHYYIRLFRQANYRLRRAVSSNMFLSTAPRYLTETAAMLIFSGLLLWGIQGGENLNEALPRLGVLALGAQRLMPLVQQGYLSWSVLVGSAASANQVLQFLTPPKAHPPEIRFAPLPFEKSMEFREVSFRYSETGPWIIRNLNLIIPKGAKIGLVGPTGSGKSTFVDLLMGLLSPTQGSIEVDGRTLVKNDLPRWRKNIAHVPQDIFLADASFAENIALGTDPEHMEMDKIRGAARKAQIAEFIESKNGGYLAEVGDRGRHLSGGQRQRVAIARALYKEASLLVLDEATSALDQKTEQAIISSFWSLDPGLTMILIAHRTSCLNDCDSVIRLDQGRAEVGSPRLLLAQK